MRSNLLFNRSQLRLASYYTGIMGLILSLCGIAVYEMTAQDHWRALNQELTALAGTLHDGLEPILQESGQVSPGVSQFLPNLCEATNDCQTSSQIPRIHSLNPTQQQGYYVRFVALSGAEIATAGKTPQGLPPAQASLHFSPFRDPQGHRYHETSLLLKTSAGQPWGYLKVGRSLQDYDAHLRAIQLVLLLGLPIAMLFVGGASWWLAGFAMEPVYQSYQKIQQFTADAAHELRTPVAAIQATIETTFKAETLDATEAQVILHRIERQNRRLSRLIQDLLLLSRMDLQDAPLERQSCDLVDLVNDLVEEFAGMAIAANLSLQAKLPTDLSIVVLGNEEQLYSLVANLMINGIKYTPEGGQVIVSLWQDSRSVCIQVQDTGIGIAAVEQTRIFDRFYRVTSDRSRQTGGAGLGLAIAQAIVTMHQGSLRVTSELNQGSTFTILLPRSALFR